MDGILPVYKPVGITSYDVIREFKRHITRTVPDRYKIGHGGTLDPFADGVLLLLLGKATKKMGELSALPKTYRAVARLGAKSETLDRTGAITPGVKGSHTPGVSEIRAVVKKFVGEIEQEIPDYSAAKIGGVPRYKLARRGEIMEKKTKKVRIYDLSFTKVEQDQAEFVTKVSGGTYIRQLSYDIFKTLGVESYLESLTRTAIGDFSLEKCCQIAEFSQSKWQDMVVPLTPLARGE